MRISKSEAKYRYELLRERALHSDLTMDFDFECLQEEAKALLYDEGAWWHYRAFVGWLKSERRRRLEKLQGKGVFDKKAFDEGRLKW